jgi:hypothetical protein
MTDGVGDISLNGKKYRIDLPSYRGRDVTDFAPRASTPTGSVVMSDMSLYQPLYQTSWQHGLGFMWFGDALGYMKTIGNIDTRQDGLAMMYTQAIASDIDNNPKFGFVPYGEALYSYGASGVRKYFNGLWSAVPIMKVTSGASGSGTGVGVTSLTFSVNIEEASNRFLFISLHLKSNVNVSSVTLNGISAGASISTVGTAPKTVLYGILAPATGTGTIVISLAGPSDIYAIATPVYNVNQTTPYGTPATLNGAGISSAVSVAWNQQNEVLDFITLDSTQLPTPNAGEVVNYQNFQTDISGSVAIRNVQGAGLLTTIYDDNNPSWIYGNGAWSSASGISFAYNSTEHFSNTLGATATLTFTGTSITLNSFGHPNRSNSIQYTIDGTITGTFSEYNITSPVPMSWTSPALTSGIHTIIFKNLTSNYMDIDYASVQSINTVPTTTSTGWTWTTSQNYAQIAIPVNVISEQSVNFLLAGGGYLFAFPVGARVMKSQDAITWTSTGQSPGASDFKWAIIHNGFVYAGKSGINRIHYGTQADLSDLQGTSADPAAIYVGIASYPTLGAIVHGANLYVSRIDGLWHVPASNVATKVLDYSAEISSNNFNSMAILNGFLFFPIRDRVIQWNGARVNDITPAQITDSFPYITYGTFSNFISISGYLYTTAQTNDVIPVQDLLSYNGQGWHKLMNLYSNGKDNTTAIGYDPLNIALWIHDSGFTSNTSSYIKLNTQSNFPYPSFPITGQNSLYTSRLDMGFRRIIKSMPSILIEAENLSPNTYIKVYFQLDSLGQWIFWDNITINGITELKSPGTLITREFNHIQLRFDFITSDSTQSPILDSYTVRFIVRPDVRKGYNFNIVAASNLESEGRQDLRTGAEIEAELWSIRNSKSPIQFVDILGTTRYVYITSFKEQPIFIEGSSDEMSDLPNTPSINAEYWINVNVVET